MSSIDLPVHESLHIGPIRIPNRVILAPMSGVSDLPFRRLAQRFGAGLVVSEMVASRQMLLDTKQSKQRMRFDRDAGPVCIQLAGTEPDIMADAARLSADRGADIIDINFGCPAKKIVRKASGSALMRDVPLATEIMKAVIGAVDVPVTVKMRTGWDAASRNAPELAKIAESLGAQMITVHGRTRCQFYTGVADWEFIAAVKDAVSVRLVANGDIRSIDDAYGCLRSSGADAVMIGRAAQGKPWFPGDVAHHFQTGQQRPEPDVAQRWAILREHLDEMFSLYGVSTGIRNARKHVGWYLTGLPGAAEFRNVINNTLDPAVVTAEISRFRDLSLETA
ncbi:MAG: tRNA dihydrouridine synthase DusB [Alphaproteobacteria bacterium]|mgnify:CR=1 FL=1|nr:tRNA dihydrouridine synthase DusB [Alphaproteobacteria bacterium]